MKNWVKKSFAKVEILKEYANGVLSILPFANCVLKDEK